MRRLTVLLVRLVASSTLLLVLVGVPLATVLLTGRGLPDLGHVRGAWRTGIVDDRVLLDVGALLFAALWAWFAIAALVEIGRVVRWRIGTRHGRRVVLGTPVPSPSGWVRRLVRVALLSTTVAASSGLTPTIGSASACSITVEAAAAPDTGETREADRVAGDHVVRIVSTGRETPYSLAARAGDPSLRDRIIDRHRGLAAPDGTVWLGGVFPVGMEIEVPAPTDHVVAPGESYWSIAEDHLDGPGGGTSSSEIAALTSELIADHADDFGRSDPTLLLPGDVLSLPPLDAPIIVEVPAAIPVEASVETPVETPASSVVPADDTATDDTATDDTLADDTPVAVPGSPAILPASAQLPPPTPIHDAPATSTPFTAAPVAAVSTPDAGRPMSTTVGGTVLLAAGALGLLESRRRHQLRHSTAGAWPEPPTPGDVATERTLRALDVGERAARLELALRSVGHLLADSPRHVVAVRSAADGTMTVVLDGSAPPAATPWRAAIDPAVWVLAAEVPTDELAHTARRSAQPCPALVHLGTSTGTGEDVFVDVEAIGVLAVDGQASDVAALTRAIAASLAASPLAETVRLVTHGVEVDSHLGNVNAESAESLDAALDTAVTGLGSTATTAASQRTFHLRAAATSGEAWEPSIVVSLGGGVEEIADDLRLLTKRGGRGLGVVVAAPATDIGSTWTLCADDRDWVLEPLGIRLVPAGLSSSALGDLGHLLASADRPPLVRVQAQRPVVDQPRPARGEFIEPDWSLLVRVLGRVDVVDHSGRSLSFDRGKSLELVAWLSQHLERPTRSAARTALWDVDVRDATFANVVSDARRSLARAAPPPDGEEWVERTLTDQLPLHPLITSDAALLRARVEAAAGLDADQAIRVLRPGLELVGDLPFSGTSYLWPDAEGITTSLILLVTGAAADLARHHLALGDVDGVFWATGQGLKVLAGHEELIGLRMRAHAEAGDLAGVRSEWDVYRRALTNDSWSCGEPSPKLVAIHRELLRAG